MRHTQICLVNVDYKSTTHLYLFFLIVQITAHLNSREYPKSNNSPTKSVNILKPNSSLVSGNSGDFRRGRAGSCSPPTGAGVRECRASLDRFATPLREPGNHITY